VTKQVSIAVKKLSMGANIEQCVRCYGGDVRIYKLGDDIVDTYYFCECRYCGFSFETRCKSDPFGAINQWDEEMKFQEWYNRLNQGYIEAVRDDPGYSTSSKSPNSPRP
jgi:hypothetical protein